MDISLVARALAVVGAGIGIAGCVVGIGMLGGRAHEAIARQPLVKKDIRTNMILMAARIEGLAFSGAILALLVVFMQFSVFGFIYSVPEVCNIDL